MNGNLIMKCGDKFVCGRVSSSNKLKDYIRAISGGNELALFNIK